MKTIAVICVLLAVALCATAVQTFEADTMSPKEISDIIQAAEPQVAGGEVQASEEDFSDDEDEDATSSELETADEEDDETSDISEAEEAAAAAKRRVVINIWGKNARRSQRIKARQSGKKASRKSGKKASRKSGKKASRKSGKKASRKFGKKASRKSGKKGLHRRSKKIHRNGKQIKKLGKKLMKGNAGKVYKKLIAQIRAIGEKSAKAIASLERRISKLKSGKSGKNGVRGPRGPKGLPGKNGNAISADKIKSYDNRLDTDDKEIANSKSRLDADDKAISNLRKRALKAGPRGLSGKNGKNGKNGKQGPRGLPGKNGRNGKDSTSLDKALIARAVAKAVKTLNAKINALAKSAQAGNAKALQSIASVSVKLGNKIQSAAKTLKQQINAANRATDKKIKATQTKLSKQMAQVRKMRGPQGARGKDGKNGRDGRNGARGAPGARGATGATGARGPQGAAGTVDLSLMDVCGVRGGDDSSCSRNPGQAYAYSVGDPHYRTWDGALFDIQPGTYWGEIVLVQHKRFGGGDIEVQTATVPWGQNSWNESPHGHGGAKGNTGLAIAAFGNVFVFYARNRFGSYFLNGRQITWHNHGWKTIATGINVYKVGGHFNIVINNGRGHLRLWGYQHGPNNMDIYGHASSSWATGKSLAGAWGDWNGNAGNDQHLVNVLNSQGKLSVLGTPRSYFKNKMPRTDASGQFLLAFDMELDVSQNHVIPGDMLTTDVEEPTKECPAKADIVAKRCKGTYGGFLESCGSDICLGADPKDSGRAAHIGQVGDLQTKLLAQAGEKQSSDTCMVLREVKEIKGLAQTKGGNSFSLSFFIKQEGDSLKGTIAKKGTEWIVESTAKGDIVFTSNGASCTAEKIISREWKSVIAVSSGTDKQIRVYVNGKVACKSAGTDFDKPLDVPAQLGSINDHIDAKIAKPVYVASGVRDNEVTMFTEKQPKCAN